MTTAPSPAELLQQMAQAAAALQHACSQLGSAELDAGQAAYYAYLCEQAGQTLTHTEVMAARQLQATGAHQLPAEAFEAVAAAGLEPKLEQIQELPSRTESGRALCKDTVSLLKTWLHLGYGAAKSRVAAAESLLGRTNEDGTTQPAGYPVLGAAFTAGTASPRALMTAAAQLRRAAPDLAHPVPGAPTLPELEAAALDYIIQEPESAKKHLHDALAEAATARRSYESLAAEAGVYRLGERNGLHWYLVKAMAHDAAVIESILEQADNPATLAGNRMALNQLVADGMASQAGKEPALLWDDSASMPEWAREPGSGIPAQTAIPTAAGPDAEVGELEPALRRLAALVATLRARSSGAPDGAGKSPALVEPKVLVHLDYEKMAAGAAVFATTSSGLALSAAEARTMLCTAGIYPVVLSGKGQVLDIGRAQRLFSPHLKRALAARDRGCLYPGCTMPASCCEADHLLAWEDGGPTSVENGALFCPNHHHARHAGLFEVLMRGGVPYVRLPAYLDPQRRLRRNTYWFPPGG